ncbi:MAG: hypothetical protein CMH63_03500, partial [Nanoarchaeota archaeon]|nr:hypothetical protein [Nanoarchaeota archaeon]
MNNFSKIFLLTLLLLSTLVFLVPKARSEIDMMSFEANLFNSTGEPITGALTIEIWDSETGGVLMYNSSDAYLNNITNGKVDIMLGSDRSGKELNLTYGQTYYMDLYVDGKDIDFNGIERQEFQSQVGNVTSNRLNFSRSIIPD